VMGIEDNSPIIPFPPSDPEDGAVSSILSQMAI
jgi:hypothetical protein